MNSIEGLIDALAKLCRHIVALQGAVEDLTSQVPAANVPKHDRELPPWAKSVEVMLKPRAATTILDLRTTVNEMGRHVREMELDINAIRIFMERGSPDGRVRDDEF